MIKWIKSKIKEFYENEYDWKFTIEFSIYDVVFGALMLIVILWILLK